MMFANFTAAVSWMSGQAKICSIEVTKELAKWQQNPESESIEDFEKGGLPHSSEKQAGGRA
jgi:hypothetical protein